MHIENTYKVVECLAQRIREEFDKGINNIDPEEMEKALCMLEKGAESLYKFKVIEAMENPISGEVLYDPNEDPAQFTMDILNSKKMKQPEWATYARRGGRSMMGHRDGGYRMRPMDFAYHDDRVLDEPMMKETLSYSDGYQAGMRDSQPDYRQGRSGNKRMTFMVSKEIHDANTPDDIAKNTKALDDYLETLWTDMEEMTKKMNTNEKNMLKSKLSSMVGKIV